MPNFATPFNGNDNKKFNKEELLRALRFSLAAEFEAIQIYEQIINSTDCKEAKKILEEISQDEKIHAGNFIYLIEKLNPKEKQFYEIGRQEADEIVNNNKE